MPSTTKPIIEILNYPASGTPFAQWQDVTTGVHELQSFGGHGLLAPRSPNPRPALASIVFDRSSGIYDPNTIPTSPVTMKNPWLKPGNRIRIRYAGTLAKCVQIAPATGSPTFSQKISGSWLAGTTFILTWYARAQSDSHYNTDSVTLNDNGTGTITTAYSYTNKWKQYTLVLSSPSGGTNVTVTFRPNGTLNTSSKPYAYIEYKNVVLTVGAGNLLANGDFSSGLTSWTNGSGYSPTIIDDSYILFNGHIQSAVGDPLTSGDRLIYVQCGSFLDRFDKQKIDLPIQRNATADQIVQTILKYASDNPAGSWLATGRRLGPRRWYRMGESSGTAMVDVGLDALQGTYMNNPTLGAVSGLTNGDSDTGVTFLNTSSQYGSIPTFDFITPKSWTVSAWVKFDSTGPSDQTFFGAYYSVGFGWQSIDLWSFTGNQIVAGFPHVTAPYYYSSGVGSMSPNTWTLATVVFDGSANTVKIYVNGVLKVTGAVQPLTMSAPTCTIGQNGNGSYYWRGGIDEVMIFDKPLSDQDVADLYNSSLFSDQRWLNWLPGTLIQSCTQIFGAVFDRYTSGGDGSSATLLDALNQTVISEYGRFWLDRDGTLQWKSRDDWFLWRYQRAQGNRKTLDLNTAGMAFDAVEMYNIDTIVNRATISYRPRQIQTGSIIVLGQINTVIKLPPLVSGSLTDPNGAVPSRTLVTVTFRDSAGNTIGGMGLVLPLVGGTDFTINDLQDGSGTDYSNSKYTGVSLVSQSGSQATFEVRSYGVGAAFLTKLQVRGYGVYSYDPLQTVATDSVSDASYGTRVLNKVLPFSDSTTFAAALASYYIYRYREPFLETAQVTFANVAQSGGVDLLQYDVGDVVLDKAGRYHEIAAIDYTGAPGEKSTMNYTLSRFDNATYCAVDDGTRVDLDTATVGL